MTDSNVPTVPLQQHIELRVSELEKRMAMQNEDARQARGIASSVAADQRQSARELSEELRLQAQKYPTREALDARTGELARRLDEVLIRVTSAEKKLSNMEGRLWAFGAGLTFIFAAITLALRLVGKG